MVPCIKKYCWALGSGTAVRSTSYSPLKKNLNIGVQKRDDIKSVFS